MLVAWKYAFAILLAVIECSANDCDRSCTGHYQPMVCQYDMVIEYYYTMSKACFSCPFNTTDCSRPQCVTGDGFKRAIMVVNRMLPGPQIRVCVNDTVIVNVKNRLAGGDGTAFHWHGMHQKGTPYMDGVPMLTQCPIPEMASFQYRFRAFPAGTHFWHSHVGFQRGDGAAGALIVKAYEDVHRSLYDYDLAEHTILLQDFPHNLTIDKFSGHLNAGYNNKAQSILWNGKGTFQSYIDPSGNVLFTPGASFTVQGGSRYRFRVIGNNVLNCPIEVSIDNHTLLMIASDGSPFEPVPVDVFTISGGERYDFVLNTNATPGSYWMYARGLADCSQYPAQQVAVLTYSGSPSSTPTAPQRPWALPRTGVVLNPFNYGITQTSASAIPISQLRSLVPLEAWVSQPASRTFYLSMDMYAVDNYHYNDALLYSYNATIPLGTNARLPQVNRVSNMLQGSPALTQYSALSQSDICEYNVTSTSINQCAQQYCECMHIIKVKVGEVVEIVWIDEGMPFNLSSHAFHLHGQYFRVTSVWQSPVHAISRDEVIRMDADKSTRATLSNRPIQKDTVTLPDGGYVIGKFKAVSPGVWFMHCHNEFHMAAGMAVIVQVGEPKDWPQPPPNFPKCGSWKLP